MSDKTYTLEELAARTGIDPRVIRSLIEQGLLLGPQSLGRYARYSDSHLNRLLAIGVLKEKRGFKLSEIRQMLLAMSEAEIVALAETADFPSSALSLPENKSNALDYIHSLNKDSFRTNSNTTKRIDNTSAASLNKPSGTNELNQLNQIQLYFQQSKTVRKQAKSDTWQRFYVTPDVELSIRGIQNEQQLARIEQIAEQLKQLFLGGFDE